MNRLKPEEPENIFFRGTEPPASTGRGPIRLVRKFYCPTCGAQHLTPIHPPRQGPDRFVIGILFGLLLSGGIWFALGFVWVSP